MESAHWMCGWEGWKSVGNTANINVSLQGFSSAVLMQCGLHVVLKMICMDTCMVHCVTEDPSTETTCIVSGLTTLRNRNVTYIIYDDIRFYSTAHLPNL